MTGFSASKSVKARSLRAIRGLIVLIAALGLLGAQALSTLHFVLVPHHLCALHGVLEDGAQGASAADRAVSDDRSADTATTSSSDSDLHEACSVATRPVHTTLPARPALERAQLGGARVAAVGAGVWERTGRAALLSRAPKTSPPAGA